MCRQVCPVLGAACVEGRLAHNKGHAMGPGACRPEHLGVCECEHIKYWVEGMGPKCSCGCTACRPCHGGLEATLATARLGPALPDPTCRAAALKNAHFTPAPLLRHQKPINTGHQFSSEHQRHGAVLLAHNRPHWPLQPAACHAARHCMPHGAGRMCPAGSPCCCTAV